MEDIQMHPAQLSHNHHSTRMKPCESWLQHSLDDRTFLAERNPEQNSGYNMGLSKTAVYPNHCHHNLWTHDANLLKIGGAAFSNKPILPIKWGLDCQNSHLQARLKVDLNHRRDILWIAGSYSLKKTLLKSQVLPRDMWGNHVQSIAKSKFPTFPQQKRFKRHNTAIFVLICPCHVCFKGRTQHPASVELLLGQTWSMASKNWAIGILWGVGSNKWVVGLST